MLYVPRTRLPIAILIGLLLVGTIPSYAQVLPLRNVESRNGEDIAVSNTGEHRVITPSLAGVTEIVDEQGHYAWIAPGQQGTYAANKPGDMNSSPHPERVIGGDDRVRTTPTNSYPYSAVVRVTGSLGVCTGWLYDDNHIATAAHCLYYNPGGVKQWAQNVTVIPAQDGGTTPYGNCTSAGLYVTQAWIDTLQPQNDYGVVKLNCFVGNQTGWFGFIWNTRNWTNQWTFFSAYHGDKDNHTTQWRSYKPITNDTGTLAYFQHDTTGGASGGPLWHYGNSIPGYSGSTPYVLAINAFESSSSDNFGPRITQAFFNFLQAHR